MESTRNTQEEKLTQTDLGSTLFIGTVGFKKFADTEIVGCQNGIDIIIVFVGKCFQPVGCGLG